MTERKYMLTISILASNRKDTLPKTLESIKPILDNVSSELIVTDTGCDEELLQIIRLYTDKIEKFEWCNDFGKARNVGLKRALGKWFMFIDDDEWFEDVEEIIHFFNSDECNQYKSFYYIVRNYLNTEGTSWRDALVNRGILLDDEVEFEDIIHEHFSKSPRPMKVFDAYAHHYGYAYDSKEISEKHFRRNRDLLEQQISQGKTNMRQYVHLLQEYNGLGDFDKAYKIALEGIDKARINGEINRRFLGSIKANAVYALMRLGRYGEMTELAYQYIKDGGLTMTSYCAINAFSCIGYWNIDADIKVIKTAHEYFALRDYLNEDKKQTLYESMLVIPRAFDGGIAGEIFGKGLICAVKKQDDDAATFIMEHLHYVSKLSDIENPEWLQDLVEMMVNSDKKASYARTIVTYMSDMVCATKICNKLLDIRERSEVDFMAVVGVLVDEESENTYFKLLKTIYYGLRGETDRLKHS